MTYNDSTRPVIQLFEKDNLVKHIDAANDVDKVRFFKSIIFLFSYHFRFLKMFKPFSMISKWPNNAKIEQNSLEFL
jgi:hypothetical protein